MRRKLDGPANYKQKHLQTIDGAFLGLGGFGCSTALQVFFPE
jgi:hypothetical protein